MAMATRNSKRSSSTSLARPGGASRSAHGVHEAMKADILSLALQPGQELDEVSLSKRYGVSRTPIREGLIRLASENLVTFGHGRRARVTPLILADYPRYIEALDLARRACSRLAAQRRHDSELTKLRQAQTDLVRALTGLREGSDAFARVFMPLEVKLHVAIAEAGHNAYLTRHYVQLLTVGHRMLHLPYAYDPRPGERLKSYASRVVARQGDLIGAIEARDADGAEAEAGQITMELVVRLRSYFEENLTKGISIGTAIDANAWDRP